MNLRHASRSALHFCEAATQGRRSLFILTVSLSLTYPASAAPSDLLATTAKPVQMAQMTPPADGAQLYEQRCSGCHSLDSNRIGPRHAGLSGRRAGSLADFAYSPALKASRIVWSRETLRRWLTDPEALIPGQRMGYRLSDAGERERIIAYLLRQ